MTATPNLWSSRTLTAVGGGLIAAAIGSALGLCWSLGWLPLSARQGLLPMAPAVAASFVLLGVSLVWIACPLRTGRSWVSRVGPLFAAGLVLVAQGALLIQFAGGFAWDLEAGLARTSERFGPVLIGRASPLTEAGLIGAAFGLLLLGGGKRTVHSVASWAGAGVAFLGFVVVLGYVEGEPLLYGSPITLMALSAGLAMLSLGTGLLVEAGPETWPSRLFASRHVRGRLLRWFLPPAVVVVVVQGIIDRVHPLLSVNAGIAHAVGALLALGAGAVVVLVGARRIAHDLEVTDQERRAHLAEVTASRDFYLKLLEDFPALVWRAGTDAGYDYVNQAFLAFTGRTPAEECGNGWADGVHPDDRDRSITTYHKAFEAQRRFEIEYRLRQHDGAYRLIRNFGRPYFNFEGAFAGYIGSCYDITDHRALDHALREAAKMEAVARLAGGVAHDLNNLLTVVTGYSDFVAEALAADHPARPDVEEVQRAGARATALIRQLVAFGGRQLLRPSPHNVNTLVRDVHLALRGLAREQHQIELRLDPTAGYASLDPSAMKQALVSLAEFAFAGMPAGGAFVIETTRLELGDPDVRTRPSLRPGSYVRLTVRHDGAAPDAAVRPHLFEPFYSSRTLRRGSGLGLSIVFGIVHQSNGHVEVDGGETGTVFRLYFPRCLPPSARAPGPSVTAETLGPCSVLLVDDEDAVRALARRSLVRRGCDVIEARDGREALALAARRGAPVDVLVTDLIMPEMDGLVLARGLVAQGVTHRVLFVSGHTERDPLAERLPGATTAFLEKPFTPDTLVANVLALMSAPDPQADERPQGARS